MTDNMKAIILESDQSDDIVRAILGYINASHANVSLPVVKAEPVAVAPVAVEPKKVIRNENLPAYSVPLTVADYKDTKLGHGFKMVTRLTNERPATIDEIKHFITGSHPQNHITRNDAIMRVIRSLIQHKGRLPVLSCIAAMDDISASHVDYKAEAVFSRLMRDMKCRRGQKLVGTKPSTIAFYKNMNDGAPYVVLHPEFMTALSELGIETF